MPYSGERIQQARRINRLTQTQLARDAGVTQTAISRYESGESQPTLQTVARIAASTRFPQGFFSREPGPHVSQGTLAFRARRSAATRLDIDQALSWTELLYECCEGLAQGVEFLPVSIPRLRGEPVERAAEIARSSLGLSADRPILNVTHALEQGGVIVLALPVALPGRDAFSSWTLGESRVPLAVIPKNGSADSRFWLSHELKHLMDLSPGGELREIEKAADAFAAEFLMPRSAIVDELQASPLSVERLTFTATRWGVTRQSVVMRATELGVISRRRAQQLFRRLNVSELPRTVAAEKPRLFRKLAEMRHGVSAGVRLAADFDLPTDLAQSMLAAHAQRSEVVSAVPLDDDRAANNVIPFPKR